MEVKKNRIQASLILFSLSAVRMSRQKGLPGRRVIRFCQSQSREKHGCSLLCCSLLSPLWLRLRLSLRGKHNNDDILHNNILHRIHFKPTVEIKGHMMPLWNVPMESPAAAEHELKPHLHDESNKILLFPAVPVLLLPIRLQAFHRGGWNLILSSCPCLLINTMRHYHRKYTSYS